MQEKNECEYETKDCQGNRFSYNHQKGSESKESKFMILFLQGNAVHF